MRAISVLFLAATVGATSTKSPVKAAVGTKSPLKAGTTASPVKAAAVATKSPVKPAVATKSPLKAGTTASPVKPAAVATKSPAKAAVVTTSPSKAGVTLSPSKAPTSPTKAPSEMPSFNPPPTNQPVKVTPPLPTSSPYKTGNTTAPSKMPSIADEGHRQREKFCQMYYHACVVTGKGADYDLHPVPGQTRTMGADHPPNDASIAACRDSVKNVPTPDSPSTMHPGHLSADGKGSDEWRNSLACREFHVFLADDYMMCAAGKCPKAQIHCPHAGPSGGGRCVDDPTKTPSKAPTTLMPSRVPTKPQQTWSPTKGPIKAPTGSPSKSPSKSPTKEGHTFSPTKAPTTTNRPTDYIPNGGAGTAAPKDDKDEGISSSGVFAIILVVLLFIGGVVFAVIKRPWESKKKAIDHVALADAQQYASAE